MVMRELDIVNPDFRQPLELLTAEDKRLAAYQEFLARLPYRREMEMVLDCNMRVARELPIYLGDSTTEILFNLSQEDPITYGHAESVAVLACMLNEEMGIGLEPHEVYVGGLLHDVWKLKLAHLLKQPSLEVMEQQGTFTTDPETEFMYWNPHPESDVPMLYEGVFFTDEQREEMHIHPVAGGAIVAALGYPQTVIDGPAQHHGYFTFQGEPYPAIPMRERNVAGMMYNVADYIAGGRARRPYKRSVPLEELLERVEWAEENGKIRYGFAGTIRRLAAEYGEGAWMRHTINLPCVLDKPDGDKATAIAA